MAASEHHMPDVDAQKISLLPWSNSENTPPRQQGYSNIANGAVHGCHGSDTVIDGSKLKRRRTHKNEGFVAAVCSWTVRNQVGLSINLLVLHALAHICFPRIRQTTRKFYKLSYYDPATDKHAAGWDDLYLVYYWIVVLTLVRAAMLDYVLSPLAQFMGISKRKEKDRFAEQAWILIYSSASWSLGMYIMYHHEHWMNYRELWTGWPNREITGMMKWYYLVQFSFWLQQIVTVNIEERRKDHWQMFTHHIVTCTLMFWSYGYHWTKVGNLILCLMDVVDWLLAIAKILKYLKYQTPCDVAFGVFMVVWFVARHVLYLKIIVSIFQNVPGAVTYGCYSGGGSNVKGPFTVPDERKYLLEPFRNPTGVICFNNNYKMGFVWTLLALQVILLVWFVMIIRVAIKVIKGTGADDTRSEDEDEEDEEEEIAETMEVGFSSKLPQPYEEEVDVEEITYNKQRSSPSRKYRKGGGMSSGVDRKELLGRIGCDGGNDE